MNWSRSTIVAACVTLGCLGLWTLPTSPSVAGSAGHSHVPGDAAARNDRAAGDAGHQEHAAALALLDPSGASHVAARSGAWSDSATWSSGIPADGARVFIPNGVTVTVNASVAAALEWVRVDGGLRFSPDQDSRLQVTTMVVAAGGALAIGEPDQCVNPDKTAQLLFTPRTGEQRRSDKFDISGGLIALGAVQFCGASKTAFAAPSNALHVGVSRLVFFTPPTGWRAGDELLFPATDLKSDDERRNIVAISEDGKTITISSPLRFSHVPPNGARAAAPVGNLTRNIVVASTATDALHQRGHVMFMTHENVRISGAAFQGLGRTSALKPHTLPPLSRDGEASAGDNPIGRYAVHFHLVSGASRKLPAQIFIGNAIVDSPKHGLVNHGGHVVAENNVTFAIHGSHFFAENGSEIGAFRHNLAVFSRGSSDTIRAREEGIADFGHGGHGFWAQSPAVVMDDNYAFHHAGAAYVIFAAAVEADGAAQNVHFHGTARIANFLRDNLDPPLRDVVTDHVVPPTVIPFRFSRNTAASSGRGLEIWNTNMISEHDLQSVVEDSTFWEVRTGGIAITYGMNTVIRNSTLIGSDPVGCREPACEGSIGITTEGRTRNLVVDNVHVAKFSTGIRIPLRGATRITGSHFDNKYNILVYPAQQPARTTIVADNTFARHRNGGEDYHLLDGGQLFHGDLSMLFERDPLIVRDSRFPGKTIYRDGQHPSAIPFQNTGIAELDGKTAGQIRAEYGLALGGMLAPEDATEIPEVGGLVGRVASGVAEMADQARMVALIDARLQAGTGEKSYTADYDDGYGLDCCNIHRVVKGKENERTGWRFVTEQQGDNVTTRLTYVDTTPPRFELDPRIKLEIHPDDVRYGFVMEGTLYDEGEGAVLVRKIYKELAVGRDGYAEIPFEYPDRSGNFYRKEYRVKITSDAAKHGANLLHYLQKTPGDKTDPGQ